MERRPAEAATNQFVADPITVGLDRSINIDMMKLSAPTNVYDADFAWIVHRPGAISFFFAKRNIGGNDAFRTRLEVRYPPENLVKTFWPKTREFHDQLQKFIAKWPKDDERDQQNPMKWTAEKDHSEWANIETMAHVGTQASLDFFLLPAWGIAQFFKGRGSSQLIVRPIVRIQMTIFELGRLLDSAADVVTIIEGYLPVAEAEAIQPQETL